ncbi:MAG: cytochrome c maturation protein CcmE [Thermoanaerobaculia bacterium]|nr:cytochrome c maturation protein CcmE [Thermoanaerobaculia bacterium]
MSDSTPPTNTASPETKAATAVPRRKRPTLYIFGTLLLLVFAGFALNSFRETLTPYVSFEQAERQDRNLQIAGALVSDSSLYDSEREALMFTLSEEDSSATMRVRYHGLKPANFEDAISIVAIGHYDGGEKVFVADKLLVKCPSKYQGIETTETKTYG